MDIKQKLDVWKNVVLGVSVDADRAYGAQCADVALSWGVTVFPGVAWSVLFKPTPSAKDMFDTANPAYFDKIRNNHADTSQLPQPGDIAVFAAQNAEQRKKGYHSTFDNPDGHIGVVNHADPNYVFLIQQDGSTRQTVTQLKQRQWRLTECIGWLRPRITAQVPPASTGPVNHPLIGKRVWLKPPATNRANGWSAYRVGQFPDRAKRIGALRPDWFNEGPNGQPGIIYTIEGVSQYANTVTVRSQTYGLIDIYLDSDAQIL